MTRELRVAWADQGRMDTVGRGYGLPARTCSLDEFTVTSYSGRPAEIGKALALGVWAEEGGSRIDA
jgi:hypothetical protein